MHSHPSSHASNLTPAPLRPSGVGGGTGRRLFDTHCHLTMCASHSETGLLDSGVLRSQLVQAKESGVTHILMPGTTAQDTEHAKSTALIASFLQEEWKLSANDIPQVHIAFGVHPEELTAKVKEHPADIPLFLSEASGELIKIELGHLATNLQTRNPIALGECGLDYSQLKDKGDKRAAVIKLQKEAFHGQLLLASEMKLPVILHVRDKRGQRQAYDDVLEIMFEFPKLRYVLHCVSGPLDYLHKALELDTFVSVAGNVTYESAQEIRDLVKATPADRLMIETDAPFLAPLPHDKSQSCQPHWIADTALFLQEQLAIDLEQVYANSLRCFEIHTS